MRRLLRISIRTLLALAVLLVLVFLLRKPLLGDWLRGRIEAELAELLGAPVTVGAIGGDWYSDFELRDVKLEHPPAHGPLVELTLARAHARFSLFDLLGDTPLAGLHRLEVSGAEVALDLTRPAAPAGPGTDESSDPLALLPDELPAVAVDGDIAVRWRAGSASATLSAEADGNELRLHAQSLDAPHLDLSEARITLRRTDRAAFELETDAEVFGVTVQSARAARADGRWGGLVELRAGAGLLRAEGGEEAAVVEVQRLDLARFARWVAAEGVVDGRLEWAGAARVTGSLTAAGVRAEGYAVDRATIDVDWNDGRITLRTLEIDRGAASIRARGIAVRPDLPWKVERVEHARFDVPDFAAFGLDLPQPVRATGAVTSADGRNLAVEALTLAAGRSRVALDGSVRLPDAPERWREAGANLTVDGVLDGWSAWVPDAPAVSGPLAVKGTLRGTAGAPRAAVSLRGGPLVVEGRALDSLALDGDLAWPDLTGLRVEAVAGADRVVVRGAADLERRTLRQGEYEVLVEDLGRWIDDVRGALRGKGRVAWDGRALSGGGDLVATGLVVEGREVDRAEVAFTARGDVVTVARLSAGAITAEGRFDVRRRVGAVTVATGPDWKLKEPLSVRVSTDGDIAVDGLRVAAFGGEVAGSFRRAGMRLDATLSAKDLDLARVDARLRGRVSGSATIAGDEVTVSVQAPRIGFQEYDGRVLLDAKQDASGIVVEKLDAFLGEALTVTGRGVVPWRYADGVWVATAAVPAVKLDTRCSEPKRLFGIEAASLRADIEGTGPALAITASVRDWTPHAELGFQGETKVTARIGAAGAQAVLETPPLAGATVSGRIALDRGFDWARPAAWRAAADEAAVEGAVHAEVPDLGPLARFMPDLRYLAGRATIRARVHGPLRKPDVAGEATIAELAATLPEPLPPLQDGAGRIVFDEAIVRCESLEGRLGYAPVRLSGTADRTRVDLRLTGENTLLARSRHLRARANVDVALAGPWDALEATGRVDVTDVLYSEPMNLFARGRTFADDQVQLFSLRAEPFASMKLDVAVRADETVRLRNNVVRGAVGVDLRILGTGAVPEPRGRITFRDTLVKLEFSSLKVDRGQLEFRPESPFAPRLDAVAHTRMRGHDIQVRAVGEIPEFEVQTTASPYLPPDDVILLLTLGLTREQLEGKGASGRVLKKAALLIGQRLYQRARGPTDPDERSFFDRFEFDMGRDVSRSGEDTIEAEFEMTRRYYLRGERDRFDDYNLGLVWRFRFR